MESASEAIERFGGPIRECAVCGRSFDWRGKEYLAVYQLVPFAKSVPVRYHCSDECADDAR